jgi:hypothetical protein
MEMHSVFCEIRVQILNSIRVNYMFQRDKIITTFYVDLSW